MNQQELDRAMRSLAAENAAAPIPADLEAQVLAAFDARTRVPTRTRWWLPATAVAVSAGLMLAIFVPQTLLPQAWLQHRAAPLPKTLPKTAEAPFIAIPYVAPPAPYERTEVMRMDVPRAALMAAGLEVHAVGAGDTVRADVLVGQDGRPLAIRFVKNAI